MTPGPVLIRECSACGKHIEETTIASGNLFDARYWTDGKCQAPMLPEQPWLVKCPHCSSLVWIDEQTQVGKIDPWSSEKDDRNRFPDARPAPTPTLQEYADFLKGDVGDREKELYVRVRAWWAGNDRRRKSEQSPPLDSFEIDNLRTIATLLDEADDEDRILKAEALRELGEFAAAEKLLAMDFGDRLARTASVIRRLNRNEVTTVAEMKFR